MISTKRTRRIEEHSLGERKEVKEKRMEKGQRIHRQAEEEDKAGMKGILNRKKKLRIEPE